MTSPRVATISRRLLLAGTAALGLTRPAFAATPGKTLRLATGEADGVKGTLDPAYGNNDNDAARASLVFERLVVPDESFAPQPQLAVSWRSDDTGQVWTFALREGVLFQDGSPFTAADVIYSYQRLLNPKIGSAAAAILAQVDPEGIRAVDDHTVEFMLRSPAVEFPLLIANRFTYIVKAGQTSDQLRSAGIGTGPFRVERFVPGEEPSVYVRNEHYWQPGKPRVDRVELRGIAEESSRIAALLSDQVDIVLELPARGLQRLEASKDVVIQSAHSSFWHGLAAFADTQPFDDVRVRQALKLVVNREQYLKAVVGGHGTVANDTPVPPWQKYGLPDAPPPPDIAAAKRLLAEAGHPNGIDVELYTSAADSGLLEIAALFKAQAEPAGIRVTIIKAPAADYWSNIWLKKPFVVTGWNARAADEALALPFLSTGEWNETHWRNKEFDGLLFEARKTLDETKRAELYAKAQRLLQKDGGAIILIYGDTVGASRANVRGYRIHPQKINHDFADVSIES